jgi:rhodanese-related sulfurtransferase
MFGLFKSSDIQRIHVNDMDDLIGKAELIDIREPYEYKGGNLKNGKKYTNDGVISRTGQIFKQR